MKDNFFLEVLRIFFSFLQNWPNAPAELAPMPALLKQIQVFICDPTQGLDNHNFHTKEVASEMGKIW